MADPIVIGEIAVGLFERDLADATVEQTYNRVLAGLASN